jgi:hypothetical protein
MKIFRISLISIVTFTLISCGGDENTEIENGLNEPANMDSSSVESDEQMYQDPAGWVLGEFFASDNNEYIFCTDGRLFFDNGYGVAKQGMWHLSNDTLYLDYTLKVTQVGIGEPLPPPPAMPGNYVDIYEEYEEQIEDLNESDYLFFSEIKDFLAEDSLYPYQIMARGFNCEN